MEIFGFHYGCRRDQISKKCSSKSKLLPRFRDSHESGNGENIWILLVFALFTCFYVLLTSNMFVFDKKMKTTVMKKRSPRQLGANKTTKAVVITSVCETKLTTVFGKF